MKIIEPKTTEEFDKYYDLRWEVLRKPWGKEKGSEKDEFEYESFHAMAVDDADIAIGVIRLQKIEEGLGQIRYMGVRKENSGAGIGSQLIAYIEGIARLNEMGEILLHSRENAVPFYLKNDYQLIEKSYLLWGEIQHFLMKKNIKN
jgi:N-acetylglutamate synthase-like GNAT family acetyltransferase